MLSNWISRSIALVRDSFERFPVTMIFALATTMLAIYAVDVDFTSELQPKIIAWLMATVLGIPLSVALHLRTEMGPVPIVWKTTLFAGLVVVLAGYGFWLPGTQMGLTQNVFLQWGLLFITSHLLVSLSIHSPSMPDRTFWAFNMHTLMRFILGVLFTGVLNIGVILAIVASDFLFNLNVDGTIYFKVTLFNHGLLMTAIIVAGISKMSEDLEWEHSVPKALRLFCLYVLLPLAFLYLSILMVYSAKVAFEWSLPEGIVGSMILYYAIVGYATHILTLPFQDGDSKSTRWFGNFFRFTMPIVLILFWIAIGLRVDAYGLTIHRGIVIYLGIWLTGISIWALFTKGRPLATIPSTLAAILVLGAIGPVSISSMSRTSQLNELRALLAPAPGNLDTEKIRNTSSLDSLSISRINSSIYYLSNTHSVASLQPFIDEPLASVNDRFTSQDSLFTQTNWDFTSRLMKEWGIPTPWNVAQSSFVSFNTTVYMSAEIRGYDHYLSFEYNRNNDDENGKTLFESNGVMVRLDGDSGTISLQDSSGTVLTLNVLGHIQTVPLSIDRGYVELDQQTATLADSIDKRMMMLLDSGTIYGSDGKWRLDALRGKLFIKSDPGAN